MLYQLSYAHHMLIFGPPEWTRTTDLRIRSPLLYPAELQAGGSSSGHNLVGARGFEPPTPCAQGRCATRLRYTPTLESARRIAKDRRPEAGSEYRFRSHEVSMSTLGSIPIRIPIPMEGPSLRLWTDGDP